VFERWWRQLQQEDGVMQKTLKNQFGDVRICEIGKKLCFLGGFMVDLDKIQSFGFQFFRFPSFQFCLSEQNLILCCRITNMNDKTLVF
jgi:hypothetical protein